MPEAHKLPQALGTCSMVPARLLGSDRRTWSFVISLGLAGTLALCQQSLELHEAVANFLGIGVGGLERSYPKLVWLR